MFQKKQKLIQSNFNDNTDEYAMHTSKVWKNNSDRLQIVPITFYSTALLQKKS